MATSEQPSSPYHRVVVLGSGPAGLTAALYAARGDLAPLVLEGTQPGGQLTVTTEVENYPGFPAGILGPELMDKMREQAKRFGAQVKFERAVEVELARHPFSVRTDDHEYRAGALIVATGATAKLMGLPAESELMGYGVSACATCDGFFFRDKEIVVVGGGDSAMEEALYLTKYAAKVTVIHRREELRASKIMQDRAFASPKIAWIWNTVVTDVVGSRAEGVKALKLHNKKTGQDSVFPTQGLFLAIGHQPNTEIFRGKLEMNDVGYIKVQDPTTKTSVAGVFACGDAADPVYRQAVTAAGTGCRAAIDAERWLEEQHD
jgi:thioredoxin reductase (NADPH)